MLSSDYQRGPGGARTGPPEPPDSNLGEYRAAEIVPGCLLESGEVRKLELRAWIGMPGSHHQIHVHHKCSESPTSTTPPRT